MAHVRLLLITHLAAAGVGHALAPNPEPADTVVAHNGFFETDTKRVLAAAVESLRAENKLFVFRQKSYVAVSAERDGFLFWDGKQQLLVAGATSYVIDLSKIEVVFDEKRQLVTVSLPPLEITDIALEPERAAIQNTGLLMFDDDQVEELTKLNYATARKAFVNQAAGRTIVATAERQAIVNVQNALALPLRIVGKSSIRVVARFNPSG